MQRTLTPELMDDPAIPPEDHRRALAGLARLNRASRSTAILWREIRPLARRLGRPITILDVATGSADLPIALGMRARRESIPLELHACDISETALAVGERRARAAGVVIDLQRLHALREPLGGPYDVVTCSLFLHHLGEEDAAPLVRNLAGAAGRLLLVSDLRRDPVGLALTWAASRALSRSPVVHADAVRSVKAAFTPHELRALASRAGLEGATIARRWPRRMLLRWSPNAQ